MRLAAVLATAMGSIHRTLLVATVVAFGFVAPRVTQAAAAGFFGMAGRTAVMRAAPASPSRHATPVGCNGRWVARRGGPACSVPGGRHTTDHHRALPIAHRRVGSTSPMLVGRYDDSSGRRRGSDAYLAIRPWSGDSPRRVQRATARLDRRLTVPGAMFHEANAPPVPSPTDIGDWL
jgi:hypothetical protein